MASGKNWDLIAAVFIVLFAAVGTELVSRISFPSPRINQLIVEPAIESVRPQIVEIRRDTREAAQQVRGDLCEVREEMRRLRAELRQEVRSWFRR